MYYLFVRAATEINCYFDERAGVLLAGEIFEIGPYAKHTTDNAIGFHVYQNKENAKIYRKCGGASATRFTSLNIGYCERFNYISQPQSDECPESGVI